VIAIVAIAIAAYVVTRPKEGTVEWYKREYLAAWDCVSQKDWRTRAGLFLFLRMRIVPPEFLHVRKDERDLWREQLSSSRAALVRLEFLGERLITFTNRTVDGALANVDEITYANGEDPRFTLVRYAQEKTNTILVIAPTATIGVWENHFQRMDVPESAR